MTARAPSLILTLSLLPALAACGSSGKDATPPPPLSSEAMAAVVEKPGVNRERLARAVDALFADSEAGETRALVVFSGGRIVAERYGEGYGKDTRLVGWSMSKTITAVMIGQLVSDGRLRLDDPAPVPAWQRPGDPRGGITIRQLLQMRSGLRHTEAGDPVYESGEVRMLFLEGRDNMAAWAEAQPLEAEPGRKFEYSSASTVILSDIATRALTPSTDPAIRQHAVADYLRTRLFEPAGMKGTVAEFDAAGTMIGSSLIHATARDWGRFGEFLRNGGTARGVQLVPSGWVDFMTSPSPRNPGYGAQTWLNRPQPDGRESLFPGRAPKSLFAALGHLGQYVIVSPEQKLTVVRLGKSTEAERKAVREHLARIVRLFP
ncbi:serine hydrolase [Novosphingobium sp. TH158]|uniref:serine hydrolase domain-containing protein n=1 Tax=Novosphingobium sp. TH158 TaxID=2067455 RepID=UPI000C7C4B95|nr:serine hydrolase [Novosphingobium sp. TH158]PLK27905.1 serine hydrolase [Novosphingobium sp. TH158]